MLKPLSPQFGALILALILTNSLSCQGTKPTPETNITPKKAESVSIKPGKLIRRDFPKPSSQKFYRQGQQLYAIAWDFDDDGRFEMVQYFDKEENIERTIYDFNEDKFIDKKHIPNGARSSRALTP